MICDGCHAGAAIFHVTVRRAEGDYATGHFCDPCYRALSKDQISDFADPRPEELPVRQPGTPNDHRHPPLVRVRARRDLPVGQPCTLDDCLIMMLRAMTVGLSEEDTREIAELMLREVLRRGGKPCT